MQKAAVLIEALPYIQRFNRKIVVVKYGGSAMVDEELKKKVIQDVVLLKLVALSHYCPRRRKGNQPLGRKGRHGTLFYQRPARYRRATMEIAEMVLNKVNKSLVQLVNELGIKAVGISGKDGMMLKCHKKLSGGQDIGYVGEIDSVDPEISMTFWKGFPADYLPHWL